MARSCGWRARKFGASSMRLAFAEREEFLDTPVKRYSSGMYVRLAFAIAAHLEPEMPGCRTPILSVDFVSRVHAQFRRTTPPQACELADARGVAGRASRQAERSQRSANPRAGGPLASQTDAVRTDVNDRS